MYGFQIITKHEVPLKMEYSNYMEEDLLVELGLVPVWTEKLWTFSKQQITLHINRKKLFSTLQILFCGLSQRF
jgi:hypothetical protein